ncbi:MAG: D-alanine--D-alanine ligase [Desulfarculales bacterium]|jgi:D-alanine-D-alanine ligase|nr:D-alanine--D-alanine ligase [Desulfarculales bacterium]
MLTIAVLSGGTSGEREISLQSGAEVLAALDPRRYKVIALDPRVDLARLVELAPSLDMALVIMHGRGGEDGCLQGLLDLLGVPYQCSGVLGCALAMNKVLSKVIYRTKELPVAADIVLHRGQVAQAEHLISTHLGWPAVVKPANEGSSLGVSIVHNEQELTAALELAFTLDELILVEEFLNGLEVTAAVLGNRDLWALPLVEIVPPPRSFFDFTAKYSGLSQEICPARISGRTGELIQDMAIRAHQALQLKGYSRSDFILHADKGPILLETNPIPGMTAGSLLPLAARSAGLSFSQLLDKLIELALESETGAKRG